MTTEVLTMLSAGDAQRLTQRIKLTASGVRDGLFKLRNLVDEAKRSNVWQVLGFQSWTAYLADTLADEPMRLGRDERQELVGYLSGEGLSIRAIAPIVGVSKSQVATDVEVSSSGHLPTPEQSSRTTAERVAAAHALRDFGRDIEADPVTGEVIEAPASGRVEDPQPPRPVTGLDGKTYTRKPPMERRHSIVDDAYRVNRDLWSAVEKLRAIRSDDRYTRNKADILAALQPSVDLAREVLADLGTI